MGVTDPTPTVGSALGVAPGVDGVWDVVCEAPLEVGVAATAVAATVPTGLAASVGALVARIAVVTAVAVATLVGGSAASVAAGCGVDVADAVNGVSDGVGTASARVPDGESAMPNIAMTASPARARTPTDRESSMTKMVRLRVVFRSLDQPVWPIDGALRLGQSCHHCLNPRH